MGWRGVLRSAVAASRAADREQQRRARVLQRGHDQIDRVVDRLESEIDRDLEKLASAEERIHAKPLSASGLTYDSKAQRWAFKDLGDQTGQLKWTLNLEWPSDPVTAADGVKDSGRSYQFVAMSATRWAVYVALRISTLDTTRPTKLFNKTNPMANRLFLVSNGTRYRALEGQLDKELPIPGSDIGLVAFPIPSECGPDLKIEFLLKRDSASIALNASNAAMFSESTKMRSLVDAAREKLTQHTDPLRAQAETTKREMQEASSSNGGWTFVAILVGLLLLIVLLQ